MDINYAPATQMIFRMKNNIEQVSLNHSIIKIVFNEIVEILNQSEPIQKRTKFKGAKSMNDC